MDAQDLAPDTDVRPVSARTAADRFPPVLDNPTLPNTRSSLGKFADKVLGKRA